MVGFILVMTLILGWNEPSGDPEAVSLLGKPVDRPQFSPQAQEKMTADLAAARSRFQKEGTVENGIWVGRRIAYLGRYRESIKFYTGLLDQFGDDPRLYRHRGHRYISIRKTAKAIADLEKAVALIKGKPNEIEQDGMPNARNIPRSTLHDNIYYHLALAYYLEGRFRDAARNWRACLDISENDDMLCATSNWYYMTLRRLGRDDEAAALLQPIKEEMDVIENVAYHKLLLMYKSLVKPDDLLPKDGDPMQNAALVYGLANWHFVNGRHGEAESLFQRLVAQSAAFSFGAIAAEAHLASR